MRRYITLASQTFKALQNQNQRLIYQFCTADTLKKHSFQSYNHKNLINNQQNSKYDKNNNQKSQKQQFQPEKPIETYCKELLENNNKRLSEITTRRELNNYRILARKTKYDHFNFAVAKAYLNNSKYFQEFFDQQDVDRLLREYTVKEFQSFFNNLILASLVLDTLGDSDKSTHLNKLFNNYMSKMDQFKELGEDQVIIYKMNMLLRFINQNERKNEKYNDYITNFVPQYFEKILEEIKFNEKINFTKYDMQFVVNYMQVKFQNNPAEQFSYFQDMFNKLNASQNEEFSVELAQDFIKIFITLLNQSEDMVVQNFKSFSQILEKSLNALQNTTLEATDIVQFYYVISRTELAIENKSQTLNLLKQLEQLLTKDQKFSLIQKKSLFYSIGKNSYLSEGISKFLESNLSTTNLKELSKRDKFDQYLNYLILSSVNLGVLTKDKITSELIQIIFDCASKQKTQLKQQKLLAAVAMSFYRAHYFSIQFWQPFLEKLDLSQQAYFIDVIMRTYKTLSNEMEPEVLSLLEQKSNQYTSNHQSNPRENAEQTIHDQNLKTYFDANNISYKQTVFIDELYSNFVVNENTCVLVFNLNNYIISDNADSQIQQLNVSAQFKVDYLEKKGYKVIIINTYDGEVTEQFAKKFSNKN